MTRLTDHQCAVLTAFTGILLGRMTAFHKYAEHLLERPVYTHEFAEREVWDRLKELSRDDVMALMPADLMDELVARAS